MRQELIQQTQDMAATATATLDSILALHAQLLAEIDAALLSPALDDPAQADRISAPDTQCATFLPTVYRSPFTA